MKQSSTFQLALFYLVLLLSHESITVANTIRQTVGLRHGAKISNTLNNVVNYMEHVDVDSFLEVENMHGMSAEAYGTLEMREMHKSLIEGFSFKHSPILDDLKTLNEIPENKILSPSELSQHRQDVTALLEKAMTGKKAKGSCERISTTFFTCSKDSSCKSDRKDPCNGDCVCDTDGINECMCIPKGHKEFYHIDTSQALKGTAQVEKSLSVKGAVGAALFGFVDGFLSGMASEMRTAFEDPKCNSGNVKDKLQNVVRKFKAMWHQMKQLHKKTWTSQGRKDIIKSIKEFISSLLDFLKEGMKYMWECPATKTIVIMVGMIAVMLLLNMAFIAGGFVVIPLIKNFDYGIIFFIYVYGKNGNVIG